VQRMETPRALIVEDDRTWQQLLAEMLTDMGLAVDVASSLDEALRVMTTVSHRLAVIDLSLRFLDPYNKDGLAVLDALGRHDPGCVPILLTGYATVEVAVEALTEHGAFSFLRKETFRRRDFLELIRRALSQPRWLETGPTAVSGEEARPQDHPPSVRGKALIVEDDAGWQSILAELLADMGFEPRTCSSFAEALSYLQRERYAVAVIDLVLRRWEEVGKETGGYRLLANTRDAGIPTVVISGMGTLDDVEQAYREYGAFAYVEKQTFDRRSFVALVEEAVTRRESQGGLEKLTPRERQVLELLAQGQTNKEIAAILVISPNTVKRHLQAIFGKLQVSTRSAAVAKWLEQEK